MQRPPKRPSSTMSNTDYPPPHPHPHHHHSRYPQHNPQVVETTFEEESDTSRRVKFRSPLIQGRSGYDPAHQDQYRPHPVNSDERGNGNSGRGNTLMNDNIYNNSEETQIPYYDDGDPYSNYEPNTYTETYPENYHQQPQQFDKDEYTDTDRYPESNQAQYQHQSQSQNTQNDHHPPHQPAYESRNDSQQHTNDPSSSYTNTQPTPSNHPNQIPEIYSIPQRKSNRALPIPMDQQDQMNLVDVEQYLNQEGGLDSNGNISGGAIIDNWTQTGTGTGDTGDDGNQGGNRDDSSGGRKLRILALHAPYGNDIAAAWWDPEKRKIEILEDTKDTIGWDLALLVIEQVQPDLILMSSKTSQTLLDRAQAWDEENRPEGDEENRTRLLLLSHKQCTASGAIAHLMSLRLPDKSGIIRPARTSNSSDTGASSHPAQNWTDDTTGMGVERLTLVKLGCWVDVHAPLAVVAAGILISEVKQPSRAEDSSGGAGQWTLEVTSLESMELETLMQINGDALTSLAIFNVEAHANMYSKTQKQALSVYGLLDTCVTPLGKKMFHTWHLRPLAVLSQIEARHEAVALFSANHHSFTTGILLKTMKRIKNLPYIFSRLRNGTAKFADWRLMRDSFKAIISVRDTVIHMAWHTPVEIIAKVRANISEEIVTMGRTMDEFIDWDASKGQTRMAIKPGVNSELDELKEVYASLDSLLNEVARMLRDQIPAGIAQDFNVIYLPQIGFHAVITTSEEDGEPPKIPGWMARFKTTDKHYYKNQQMIDLDAHYGDIYVNMTSLEIDIIQDITGQLQQRESLILAAVDVIAELDCLLALAKAVPRFNLRRPRMTNDTTLRIREGRHILIDQVCSRYVPNDIILEGGKDGEHHNMMIVTGANGSGKSAYGKQIAVIVIMAQMGSFVPAQEAVIGICDKIFTRLQTKESASKHASAFMIDLGQVSQALRGATERSLIILDEFGKGTITWDGAGLLAGVIEYFQKGPCPRTIVLTHFHELITQRFLEEDSGVMFAHMKTLMVPKSNELHFMFKLAPGPSHTSYAAQCALQHNIPSDVVARAQFVTECVSKFELHKLYDTTLTEKQEDELRANEDLAKLFLGWTIDEDTQNVREMVENMLEETDVDSLTRSTYTSRKDNVDELEGDDSGQEHRGIVEVDEEDQDVLDGVSVDPSDDSD